jgi:hypothetical protein
MLVAGCAQPTSGTALPDQEAAAAANQEAFEQGLQAFRDHFAEGGTLDEHATAYNYVNFGDKQLTTEHESFQLGTPPLILTKRRYHEDGDWSQILTPPRGKLDYIELDEDHADLAPTPWVSTPTRYEGEFHPCYVLTAWLACKVDTAISQTTLSAPDRQPTEARVTDEGFEVVTGATLDEMIAQLFITLTEEEQAELTEPMLEHMVPVTIRLDRNMTFVGFELSAKITDGDAPTLEIQLGYETLGDSKEDDFPEAPKATEVTAITDPVAVEQFWAKFNTSNPE